MWFVTCWFGSNWMKVVLFFSKVSFKSRNLFLVSQMWVKLVCLFSSVFSVCVQMRRTKTRSWPSRGASSPCVWMDLGLGGPRTRTTAAPPCRCYTEEAAGGAAGTAGSTKLCRWRLRRVLMNRSFGSGSPSSHYCFHLQFIVGEDGTCGANYEHAPAEGPPIVALIDHVVEFT